MFLLSMKLAFYFLVMFAGQCKADDNMKEIATYLFGGMGAFFAVLICLGLCCACVNSKLDALNPRRLLGNMGETELIAGGVLVAGATYMDRKEDSEDRELAAQLQGPGYAPVPQHYPQNQPGYPQQQPGYPQQEPGFSQQISGYLVQQPAYPQ
eukprot:GFUD01106478.1.p1 GENE.GFUD01106478.1~~GFUD01106478.1.p1  ORF type:complete len:153 (-),score=44.55 GFUD01106478.1:272-730(-)